jgi:hypothetical protein
VVNFKFPSQGFNSLINKMCTLITHEDILASKPSYDIIKYEMCSCSFSTIFSCSFFGPSGQVLCRNDYVPGSCALPWVGL